MIQARLKSVIYYNTANAFDFLLAYSYFLTQKAIKKLQSTPFLG